ncbi:MAG: hypothetical protein MI976_17290 [Pseudomonadales bacterium]|nr:hypothetical protein [Pseudomonadales bacterium]
MSRPITCSLLAILLLSNLAYADSASFDQAVNEYLKGFRACSDANTLRMTNIVEANKKFEYYRQQLDLAVSIDESILTSTDREMDSNLNYCQRVEDNLKRAEATPILEYAFDFCEKARVAYDQGLYKESRQQFEEYRRYKEDAFAITESIGEVFVLSSQVRSCGRFEQKLGEKEALALKQSQMVDEVIILSQEFQLECDSTLAYVSREGFGIAELLTANKMLADVREKKETIESNQDAFNYASLNPEEARVVKLTELLQRTQVCETAIVESIRKVSKQQRALQNAIKRENSRLTQSLAACEKAKTEVTHSNLAEATSEYQNSASLKKKATTNRTVERVKKYPNWKESSQYNRLLQQTKTCQTEASNAIKKLQAVIAEIKAQQERQERQIQAESQEAPQAATPTITEKETSTDVDFVAEDSEQDLAEPADEAWIDEDLPEAVDDSDNVDDFGSSRKSWTDLIK